LFGRRDEESVAPVAPEFAITDRDVERCHSLVTSFDTVFNDHDRPDDDVTLAINEIAESGSGLPVSSWAPHHRGGYKASDRAWRWMAACSRAAVDAANNVVPITVAEFAVAWENFAPEPSFADPVQVALLKAPPEVLADLLASSVVSSGDLDAARVVAHIGGGTPITVAEARNRHAHMLLNLEKRGQAIDARARALALQSAS
jgi:hypothetical protein